MRYGYFAYEQRKISINKVDYGFIGFAEMNSALRKHETSVRELREWGFALLRTGRYESGYFNFCYGEIDDYDEPGDVLATVDVAWDGSRELMPSES
ncbi:hypothetical protein [Amycolatopsis sp. NPDC059021]|uniref:hypothetical protein n=1 Tax=Amycolatopsis sp. NPDC059021 TaxID=3346704 RepID=UPI00366CFB78